MTASLIMNRNCHPRLFLIKQDQKCPIHTCKDDISFVIFRIGSEKIHWTLGQFHLKKKHFDVKATHSKYQFSSLRLNSGNINAGDQTSRWNRKKREQIHFPILVLTVHLCDESAIFTRDFHRRKLRESETLRAFSSRPHSSRFGGFLSHSVDSFA